LSEGVIRLGAAMELIESLCHLAVSIGVDPTIVLQKQLLLSSTVSKTCQHHDVAMTKVDVEDLRYFADSLSQRIPYVLPTTQEASLRRFIFVKNKLLHELDLVEVSLTLAELKD
jgi:hypothetical protein